MGYESPAKPLRTAVGTRLAAAYTAAARTVTVTTNPGSGLTFPYTVLSAFTENDGFSSKTTAGSVMTYTIRTYAASENEAQELAAIAIEAICDRSNPLTLADPFYQAGRTGLDLNEIIEDQDDRGTHWGALIRFRFIIGQRE